MHRKMSKNISGSCPNTDLSIKITLILPQFSAKVPLNCSNATLKMVIKKTEHFSFESTIAEKPLKAIIYFLEILKAQNNFLPFLAR